MYQLILNRESIVSSVYKYDNSVVFCIPFAPANSDYQTFKRDLANGVELQDPEGNVMTQEQVDDFLKTIP